MAEEVSANDFLKTLDNLKIPYTTVSCREHQISENECPALVFPASGTCYVAISKSGRHLEFVDAAHNEPIYKKATRQRCYVVRIDRFQLAPVNVPIKSVSAAFAAIRPMLPWLIILSLFVNVLGLLTPLLIMAIYDRVIPSGSVELLLALSLGALIVLASDFAFRFARTRALAYVGREGERTLSLALFQKLMSLPLGQLQKSDVDQQLARFKQFEYLREVFSGQVMATLLDLPFAVLFLAVLLYLAPPVGFLTLAVAVFFALLSFMTLPKQQSLDQVAGEAAAANRAVLHDLVLHQSTINNLGLKTTWVERSLPLATAAEAATRRAKQYQTSVQSLAQSVAAMAGVGAIVISASAAMAGSLSFGALIAVISLVSKVLAPITSLHANLAQILSFSQSQTQADRVLALPQESELGLAQSHLKSLSGHISLSAVTHKPDPLNAPLLSQVSMSCFPGEIVVVMASDVASRASILDLVDSMYAPLTGNIEHDGCDIRQIAVDELRRSVSYSTLDDGLFYGTIAQNFRLAAPTLSDDEIYKALSQMGVETEISRMPEGIHSRLTDEFLASMSSDVKKALELARCIARTSPICLFAEPTNLLNNTQRAGFKRWLAKQSGERTVLISTADRSLLEFADRYIFLEGGRLVVNDTGENGHKKILAALKK